MWKNSAFEDFKQNVVHIQDGQQHLLTVLRGVPLSSAASFCDNRNYSSLILKHSSTSKTPKAVQTLLLACTRALRGWTTALRLFVVFLRDAQGTEMFRGSKSCNGVSTW